MAILPDKIIQDYEFEAFIKRVNEGAEKIISDPKFKLTTPDLPGLSFLIKLQIRVFEKSLASSFAPIFLGKKALSEGFSAVKDAFEAIKTLFSNPLQFLLDEGVNSTLEDFPFPLRLELGGSNVGSLDLPLSDASDLSGYRTFNYNPLFNSSSLPGDGEYTTPQSSIEDIRSISISKTTNTDSENIFLSGIKTGDPIQISDGVTVGNYTVSRVQQQSSNNSVNLELNFISASLLSDTSAQTSVPGFGLPSIGFEKCQLAVSNFIDPSGSLKIPISSLGVNIPLLGGLTFVIGDFSKLKDSSPTKKFVDRLSQESGLEFQDVFGGILSGNFPKVDFAKIQEEAEADIGESEEQSKVDLITVARFLQIGVSNPCFLITVILNYVKLLLLPIKVVVNVLKGLGDMITGPIKLIKTIITGLTNPLKLICDLISQAFLEVLKPYIQPSLTADNITWTEALEDPNDSTRGLRPLISDMICGKFNKRLKDYIPNQSFFDNLSNQLSSLYGDSQEALGPQIPYDLRIDGLPPSEGQVSVNSGNPSDIRNFKASTFSNTVENATGLLASLSPGDEFTFSFDDQSGKYRVSTKRFVTDNEFPYFELAVQPVPGILESSSLSSNLEKVLGGLNIDTLKAQLSITNPDKEFLLIVEKYLPIKLVAIWEAIKGIIAIFGSLAQQVPSLLPAVIRGLFSNGNDGQSEAEILAAIESGEFDQTSTAIDSAIEVTNLLYGGGSAYTYRKGLVYQSTRGGGNGGYESINALYSIINNSPYSLDPGIEEVFYDLGVSLTASGKQPVVFKSKLSTKPGRSTEFNNMLNRKVGKKLVFRKDAPGKSVFYWGSYNLNDVGNTVKVLSVIMQNLWYKKYFDKDKIDLEKATLKVYVNNDTGTGRKLLYSGNYLNALRKYKFEEYNLNKKIALYDLRIVINRQMDLLVNYLLPSLK